MNFQPFCKTEIEFMTQNNLKNTIKTLSKKNQITLVMSESSAKRLGFYEMIQKILQDNKNISWISEIDSNPTQQSVINSLRKLNGKKPSLLFAIGGGSAIDLAKGISAFYDTYYCGIENIEDITKSLTEKKYYNNEFIDIIACPTTSGTGSEVTQWATIWDVNKNKKYSIDYKELQPKKAIIVSELTCTVPLELTLSTGLDALTQATEAYWSKFTNPLVQDIAYRAIELVLENLPLLLKDLNNLNLRTKLARASLLAGVAFSNTRTTACHSISYPLTMIHNIPHGLAVVLTLESVLNINTGHFNNDQELIELFSSYGGLRNWLRETTKGIVEMNLSYFGIEKEDISNIVDHAFTGGRMDNNPVDLTKEDVMKILAEIL